LSYFLISLCYQVKFCCSVSLRTIASIFPVTRGGAAPSNMLYKITVEPEYLKAELFNRETMEETREFLQIVAGAAMRHQRSWVLICVHASNPVFTVERSGFLAYFRKLSADPSHKIALLGDSEELGISHQYIELIGRQHGINVQSFRDEGSAVKWFNGK
jgi:hypothetical protein